jgi:hypothetical protein
MSRRDHGLLEAAGLSIADAAKLFNRSRQALYTGLAHERDYFSAEDAMAVMHDAKRRDSDRIEALTKFIRAQYSDAESSLILLDQVGYEQVSRVVRDADHVILVFNGYPEHLTSEATFAKVLKDLIASGQSFTFVIPSEWVIGYMDQNLGIRPATRVATEDITYLPSFLVMEKQGAYRAFFFLHLSVEGMTPTEAARLWMYFSSRYSGNSVRKSA